MERVVWHWHSCSGSDGIAIPESVQETSRLRVSGDKV